MATANISTRMGSAKTRCTAHKVFALKSAAPGNITVPPKPNMKPSKPSRLVQKTVQYGQLRLQIAPALNLLHFVTSMTHLFSGNTNIPTSPYMAHPAIMTSSPLTYLTHAVPAS